MQNKTLKDDNAKTVSARKAAAVAVVIIFSAFGLKLLANRPEKLNSPPVQVPQAAVLQTTKLSVNGKEFTAEVTATEAQKQQGLSGREFLAADKAMLFPYDSPDIYCFWMKDMKFPIDIVWLNSDKTINTIHANVQPETYPNQTFCPETPAWYVVEFSSGTAAAKSWQKGTQFSF
ncbi:MAG: DUF192 domain-containing protein [bacterium]|nr:DUF192 domain-containing protein [bacterium]